MAKEDNLMKKKKNQANKSISSAQWGLMAISLQILQSGKRKQTPRSSALTSTCMLPHVQVCTYKYAHTHKYKL